jgi:hypothetical protein
MVTGAELTTTGTLLIEDRASIPSHPSDRR